MAGTNCQNNFFIQACECHGIISLSNKMKYLGGHLLGRHPLKGTISSNCKKLYDKIIWYEVIILWRYNDTDRTLNLVFTHIVSN